MTMQRRHFELIAGVFEETFQCFPRSNEQARNAIEKAARIMCRELKGTNDAFNPSRFLRACGIEDNGQ